MLYIGIDDTDNLTSRGTGFMARQLARILEETYRVWGITRHQLLIDPRVPMTAKNSCAAIHLHAPDELDLQAFGDWVAAWVLEHSALGSDPGVCLACDVADELTDWGLRVQRELVTQDEAQVIAARPDVYAHGLGGTRDGIIGALAAVGLAASGSDGRFISVGTMRDLVGTCTIQQVLEAGIAQVRTNDGTILHEGIIETGGKLRPALRDSQPVLVVEPRGENYMPLKLD